MGTLSTVVTKALLRRQFAPAFGSLSRALLRTAGINLPHDASGSGERWLVATCRSRLGLATAVDVGANVGGYAQVLLDYGYTVRAYEPGPAAFSKLAARFAGNDRVTCLQLAVGEAPGTIEFAASSAQDTLSSRDPKVANLTPGQYKMISVEQVTLSDIGREFAPEFVKIDVEGFEMEVLSGARELLASRPPAVLQFEFDIHHLRRGQSTNTFRERLKGFELLRLCPGYLVRLPENDYLSNVYTYQNLVAVRADVLPRLGNLIADSKI